MHLKSRQLEVLEDVIEHLHFKFHWSNLAQPHLAYPDISLDQFSGSGPDQDAEAFIRLTECKINQTPVI